MTVKQFPGAKPPIEFEIGDVKFEALGTLAADPFVDLLAIVGEFGRVSRGARERAKAAREAKEQAEAEGKSKEEVAEIVAEIAEEGGDEDRQLMGKMRDLMAQAVTIAMTPEQGERIMACLTGQGEVPIEFSTLSDIMVWLLEVHKISQTESKDGDKPAEPPADGSLERPTPPPSDSQTGSSTTGGGSEVDSSPSPAVVPSTS